MCQSTHNHVASQSPHSHADSLSDACAGRGLWPVPARGRGPRPMACWEVLGGLWPLQPWVHRSPLWRELEGLWPAPVQMHAVVYGEMHQGLRPVAVGQW